MGNQIVIPSMGNWYVDPLRRHGIGVKNILESGTFFITLDCYDLKNPQNELIVKAYESNEPLDKNDIAMSSKVYLENLSYKCKEHSYNGLSIYTPILQRNMAFLCRKKHQFTLSQRLEEYPPLELVEKRWISYRVLILVSLLHQMNFFHGSINPDNIFLTWDLDVSIGDMAQIKPTHININRPDLFHHYFATASRGFCYLSPEQLLYSYHSTDDVLFNMPSFPMDYFAVGLVIYFTYTGEHMLDFSTLSEISLAMKAKQNENTESVDYSDIFDEYIEKKIKVLPDDIHNLVKNLLNLDPNKRLSEDTLILFTDMDHKDIDITTPFFPSFFRQISDQLDVFFQKNMSLEHMIRLIPMFQMIINAIQEKAQLKDEKKWNSKIPLSKSLKMINPTDVKLFLVNFFTNSLSTSEKVQERASFLNFICDYTLPLSDNTKLSRILPVFCETLSLQSNLLKTTAMVCILKLIASISDIPEGYEGIFSSYLIKIILNSLSCPSIQYKIAMASICPCLTIEIDRLQTETSTDAVGMTNAFLNKDEVLVSKSFIQTLRKISRIKAKNEMTTSISTPALSTNFTKSNIFQSASAPGLNHLDQNCSEQCSIYGINIEDGILHHCRFDLFEKFSDFLLSYLNSSHSSLKLEILLTFRDFFENSPFNERSQYRKKFEEITVCFLRFFDIEITTSLMPIDNENPHNSYDDLKSIDNSSSVLTHCNDDMIEGYLDFFLWFVRKDLLNINYSAALFLRISKFRHSHNPTIRFLSSKLVSAIKIDSNTVQYTNFLMNILYNDNQISVKKKSSEILLRKGFDMKHLNKRQIQSNNTVYQRLMFKIDSKLNPKFIKSEKLSPNPISIIAPHFNSEIKAVVSDSNGNNFVLSDNLSFNQIFPEKKFSAISELKRTNSTMFVEEETGKLIFYDWKNQKEAQSKLTFESNPLSIISKENNVCFALTKSNQLILFDSRCSQFQHSLQFDQSNLTATSMCSWPNNETHPILAVGFKEGFVQIIDSRVMLPISSIITNSVNNVIPCCRHCCNFVVSSDNTIEVFDAFLGCSELIIDLPRATITPYVGNVVITANTDVLYLDCENFEASSILQDQNIEQMIIDEFDIVSIPSQFCKMQSLHKHSTPITITDHNKEMFMSGDVTGMLNLWCISDL